MSTQQARDQLKAFIERIERLEEEKKTLADDIKDVFAEAKAAGYDTKALKAVIKERKQDQDEVRLQQQLIDTYKHALGMLADLPLGEAAISRASERTRSQVDHHA